MKSLGYVICIRRSLKKIFLETSWNTRPNPLYLLDLCYKRVSNSIHKGSVLIGCEVDWLIHSLRNLEAV